MSGERISNSVTVSEDALAALTGALDSAEMQVKQLQADLDGCRRALEASQRVIDGYANALADRGLL